MTNISRWYPTSITLSDGRILTLLGLETGNYPPSVQNSIEDYDPNTGTWGPVIQLPWSDQLYYPWTYLLPGGDIFIAGPHKTTRRFSWQFPVPDPAKTWDRGLGDRGTNMQGTSVLLPLRPPKYEPRVLVMGGNNDHDTSDGTRRIEHSRDDRFIVSGPILEPLPSMSRHRSRLNSVILPDGRIFVAGGDIDEPHEGGPAEIFDPDEPDPDNAWFTGASIKYSRGYHSCAILLPDGSVLMGEINWMQ